MAASNITVNQGTQTPIATDSVGGTQFGIVKLDMGIAGVSSPFSGTLPQVTNLANGTLSQVGNIGTLPNLPGGSIVVTAGTIASDTIIGGTVNLTQTVSTVSMLSAGTITTLPNIPGGTITNLASGTINSATAVINSATISVLPNLPQGSIQVTSGTITTGTILSSGTTTGVGTISNIGSVGMVNAATITVLPNIPGGTITSLVSGTINSATAVVNSATISVLPNLPQGSINITAGTIATLGTMGTLGLVNTVTTVSSLTNGSIVQTAGTINIGTIVGKDANAAAQVGNPITIAGTNSGGSVVTFVTAQSAIDTSAPGLLGAGLLCWDGAFWRAITAYAPGDGNSNDSALETMARNQMWNGASWDRMRGNQDGTFLASGTYNTTQTQADQTNYNFRGIRMTMDITGTAATGTLTPEIDGKDVASGKYYAILTGGAVPAQVVSTNTYEIYPAIGTSVSKASDILPRTFRIKVSETGSGTITYSVGYSLIV